MRISPFHMELAKRIAQGQPNRDIMKEVKISGSRLSVLKANPIFQSQVEKYRKLEADKYQKAVMVFAESAENVAKEMVLLATGILTPHKTKLDAGVEILNRVAQSEGVQAPGTEEEVVFEQMLKVTKRSMGRETKADDNDATGEDLDKAQQELEEDLVDEGTTVPAFMINQLKSANI